MTQKPIKNTTKSLIRNRLKSLTEVGGTTVTAKGDTLRIHQKNAHAMGFTFKWLKDHWVGYFIDRNDNESQAVVTLNNGMDAINFAAAYSILLQLRARRQASTAKK